MTYCKNRKFYRVYRYVCKSFAYTLCVSKYGTWQAEYSDAVNARDTFQLLMSFCLNLMRIALKFAYSLNLKDLTE